jgi:imidazolonepropionase-like amidohydrolase
LLLPKDRQDIGIGSDWSPSGSKNLLGELKVAWLVAQQIGGIAKPDIVAMATRTAAKILGWGAVLGTLEPGKLGDLIVVEGTSQDPTTS